MGDIMEIITIIYLLIENFSLQAGVTSVLDQLQLSCREESSFRAFNLDVVCPDHIPMVTSCTCLTKNREGELIAKTPGHKTFKESCKCSLVLARSSPDHHVITRLTCCTTSRSVLAGSSPHTSPQVAEKAAQVVFCPPEAPYKTRYRSVAGVVSCGDDRMVSRCLCLNKRLNRRRTGTVVGTSCMCRENMAREEEEEVARAVCCSTRKQEEGGDSVFQQQHETP